VSDVTARDRDADALQDELDQYRREKEKIRDIVGQIGGVATTRKDRTWNVLFIVAIVFLLLLDIARHALGWHVPIPPLFSIELGVLLVSVKIIWMIHKQTRIEHFQFWILNSIEFRLNDMSKRVRGIESELRATGECAGREARDP
jgi:hypothetical protein